MNPMPNGIFIIDEAYTFQEFARILTRAILSIDDENEEAVFSIADVLHLLRSVNEYVPGEFELRRTHSHCYQIVYKAEDAVIESFKVLSSEQRNLYRSEQATDVGGVHPCCLRYDVINHRGCRRHQRDRRNLFSSRLIRSTQQSEYAHVR